MHPPSPGGGATREDMLKADQRPIGPRVNLMVREWSTSLRYSSFLRGDPSCVEIGRAAAGHRRVRAPTGSGSGLRTYGCGKTAKSCACERGPPNWIAGGLLEVRGRGGPARRRQGWTGMNGKWPRMASGIAETAVSGGWRSRSRPKQPFPCRGGNVGTSVSGGP